jgi:hypothetical protein
MTTNEKPIAIKFTYALEAYGGFWIAFNNGTTDYTGDLVKVRGMIESTVIAKALHQPGQWTFVQELSASEREAWNQWGLV